MKDIIFIIQNVGFPVFVAVFVLIRLEPTIRRLEVTITKILAYLEKNGH